MPKSVSLIPKAPLARILMSAGAKRVSASAADAFVEVLEEKARNIAARAFELAKHSGRKTIHEEDIKLAVK
jgi:histone H3/H4